MPEDSMNRAPLFLLYLNVLIIASCGLVYELLAGSTPFDAKELMSLGLDAMRKTIREKEPQRPSTRLATLGADQLTTTAKRRSAVSGSS